MWSNGCATSDAAGCTRRGVNAPPLFRTGNSFGFRYSWFVTQHRQPLCVRVRWVCVRRNFVSFFQVHANLLPAPAFLASLESSDCETYCDSTAWWRYCSTHTPLAAKQLHIDYTKIFSLKSEVGVVVLLLLKYWTKIKSHQSIYRLSATTPYSRYYA